MKTGKGAGVLSSYASPLATVGRRTQWVQECVPMILYEHGENFVYSNKLTNFANKSIFDIVESYPNKYRKHQIICKNDVIRHLRETIQKKICDIKKNPASNDGIFLFNYFIHFKFRWQNLHTFIIRYLCNIMTYDPYNSLRSIVIEVLHDISSL